LAADKGADGDPLQIVNDVTTGGEDKALSAEQGMLAAQKNKLQADPTLWPVNTFNFTVPSIADTSIPTEIDLGDGLYGLRYSGTVTIAANQQADVRFSRSGAGYIVRFGGFVTPGGSQRRNPIGFTANLTGAWIACDVDSSDEFKGQLRVSTSSNTARTGNANSLYEVWIMYKKTF
jgi:hypothetical protein